MDKTIELVIFLIFSVPLSAADIITGRIFTPAVAAGTGALLVFRLFRAPDELLPQFLCAVLSALSFSAIRSIPGRLKKNAPPYGLGRGDVVFSVLCGFFCSYRVVSIGYGAAAAGALAFWQCLDRICRKKRRKLPFIPFMTAGITFAACKQSFLLFFFHYGL